MKRITPVILLLVTTALAGCGEKATAHRSAAPVVKIVSFTYRPGTIDVPRGAKVTWHNADSAEHTVTSDARDFDISSLKGGRSGSVVFRTAGTFRYHCDFHPFMKGSVVVR
jgi:plastocyanin